MIAKIYPHLTPQPDLNGELRGVRYFDIRKLTELECFRLMDVDEADARIMCDSPLLSKSARYKLAGNSIVVNCLYLIFEQIYCPEVDPTKQPSLFADEEPQWAVPLPDTIRLVTLCSGYDSQALAMRRFCDNHRGVSFDLSAWSEFDPESKRPLNEQPAVIAHNLLFPQWADRNLGDMTAINWGEWRKEHPEEIDILTYSTPCFVAGTPIRTKDGYKPIEEVVVGDMVYTHKGRLRKVVETMKHDYVGQFVDVESYEEGGRIRCTANHPFYVRDHYRIGREELHGQPQWVWAGQISPTHQLANYDKDGHLYWHDIGRLTLNYGEAEVYNLEVEEDHSYIALNAIVHNCQSISQAGKREGIKKGSGTRSAVLWSTEDAIRALRPKFLLQENVRALCNKVNMPDFEEWQKVCNDCGYDNYWTIMNAKNYGIPQNRERVFMLSVRRDLNLPAYTFPRPFPLEGEVADVLEQDADESYYLNPTNVIKFLQANQEESDKGIIYLQTDHKYTDEELAEIRSNAVRHAGETD